MIIHCSKKLSSKLADVSKEPLNETSPLGSWHGHLVTLDRRQCLFLCHDETRFVLFLPGMLKEHFSELGSKWFRQLFTATLAAFGCPDVQIRKAELALGPLRFDTSTDRSVQGTLRVSILDLEIWIQGMNVMELDPLATSCRLSHRPVTIRGKWLWPEKAMLEKVAAL